MSTAYDTMLANPPEANEPETDCYRVRFFDADVIVEVEAHNDIEAAAIAQGAMVKMAYLFDADRTSVTRADEDDDDSLSPLRSLAIALKTALEAMRHTERWDTFELFLPTLLKHLGKAGYGLKAIKSE